MKAFPIVRSLPQPLKTLYVLWFLGVLAAVILIPTHHAAIATAPLGVIVVLTGLTLLTNFRGGTDAIAQVMKTRRPLGIDYSRSFVATTTYGRVFGVLAIVVGGGFLYGALAAHRGSH